MGHNLRISLILPSPCSRGTGFWCTDLVRSFLDVSRGPLNRDLRTDPNKPCGLNQPMGDFVLLFTFIQTVE